MYLENLEIATEANVDVKWPHVAHYLFVAINSFQCNTQSKERRVLSAK